MMNASFPDRSREHWTEPVPPEPNRLVADIDAPLMEQVLDLPQRQRIADIHHHREADYLGRRVEITEGVLHCRRLRNATHWLKPICSDNAIRIALENIEPELAADIYEDGIHLTGGGALLDKISTKLARETGVKYNTPDDPLRCVAIGTGHTLEKLDDMKDLLVDV